MNFHKVVGKEPCRGLAVVIVRGVQPDVVQDRDRAGNVFVAAGVFLGAWPSATAPDATIRRIVAPNPYARFIAILLKQLGPDLWRRRLAGGLPLIRRR